MRHAIIAVLLLAALAGPAVAGPFEDALAARERGDYATALREFRVLAEQGDADAQYNLGLMYTRGRGRRTTSTPTCGSTWLPQVSPPVRTATGRPRTGTLLPSL